MVVQMMAVGEDTGALDDMLHKISEFYDQEVEATTEALTSLIEPLMIAFLGGIVGSMIVASTCRSSRSSTSSSSGRQGGSNWNTSCTCLGVPTQGNLPFIPE